MDINFLPSDVMIAWGIPGTIILIEAAIIWLLLNRLTDSQEQRVKEIIDMILKYEEALNKFQQTLDAMIDMLKEKENGK